ncbi:Ig-like domain repeat protein [Paenibacillus ehimensis]|uniref:Ig-like domain repeat protein n=1 Tax=Paenibacillus ehimensis TaxID=79264 RepID=A0ABT8VCH6_9BACL|nr:Ig-like domain repeat protein [Paenibacillus ehimensis]MDO3678697.1 Ig-like domain repeat protein [Paenibacillus ehimensis]
MPYIDCTARKDANWRAGGTGSGTSDYMYIGEMNPAGVGMVAFNSATVPAGHHVTELEIILIGDGYAPGITSGNIIFRALSDNTWSEYSFAPNHSGDIVSYPWSGPPTAYVQHRFTVPGGWNDNLNQFFDKGVGIWFSGNGLLGFKTRESGYPPILRIWHEPNSVPNAPGLITPVHGSITNNRNPVFNWTFSDPDGGDYQTAWQIQVSAGDGGAFTNVVVDSGKNTTKTNQWTFYGLGDNQYFYRIRTWDKADAVSPWSWVPWFGIENTPPVAGSITGTQHLNVQPNGTFRVWAYNVKDNWSGVSVVRFPTAGPGYDFQWRDGVKDGGSDNWFCDIPINAYNNNEGTYTTHVYAYDNAGNSGFLGEIKTNVDRTPATIGSVSNIQYTQGSSARVWAADVTDGLSGVDRVTVHVVRPDGSWYFLANAIRDGSSNNYFIDVPLEYEGNWGVDFRAYDRAQNEPVMVRANVIRDNSTPKVTGVQGYSYSNQTGGTRRTWIYGVSDALSGIGAVEAYYVRAGMSWIGPYAAGQSGSDYYFDVPIYSGDGEYAAHFYIRDKAGNQSGPHEVKFFVDSKRANDPNPSVVYGTNSATISWLRFSDPTPSSGYDRTGIWLGEWSGTDWVGGTPNIYNAYEVTRSIDVLETNVSTLKPGARYRYAVAHYDKSGNQSSYTWFEFVTKKKIGEYRTKAGAAILSLPVYDPASGVLGSKALRCGTKSGVGCFELVSPTDPSASPFRIQTHQGIQAIAK